MKKTTAIIRHDGKLATVTEEIPELKENEVLIEVCCSLISPGTEMSCAKSRREKPAEEGDNIKFGYSNAGKILAVKGDCGELVPGMRVAAMGAGNAEHTTHAIVPKNLVVPIPDEVTYEQATYLSLAATALQAVRRTSPKFGEYGSVLGLGIVGNLACQLYKLAGCRVIGEESFPKRVEIAKACGIDVVDRTNCDVEETRKKFAAPYGLDFALFAFGGDAEKAFMSIKKGMKVSADGHAMGNIVLVGGCRVPVDGGAASGNLNICVSSRTGAGYHDKAWEYGAEYPNAFVQFTTQRNARELIKLIAEKRLNVDALTTHRFPLSEAEKAGDLLCENPQDALGVIFEMDSCK